MQSTNPMRAKEREWAFAVRNDAAMLASIEHCVDGPYHIINPDEFGRNLKAFQDVLVGAGVSGHVYFGKKANKAGAWLRQVSTMNGSVDVASAPELVHALANGVPGNRIGVTGAAKTGDLLWLASRHGSVVAIDALDELERAISIAKQSRSALRILLRVLPSSHPDSRFGLNRDDLQQALSRCVSARDHIIMDGFSFHLDGYTVAPRAELASALVHKCQQAREAGLRASTVCIGGGFACSYVEEEDWRKFVEQLRPSQFHAQKTFGHFYPYYQNPTGAAMLDAILQTTVADTTLATKLRVAKIDLHLEPGRALVDGTGMTVFPVLGFKRNSDHGIVTVAGVSMSLAEQWRNSEFLPTPILIQRGPPRRQEPIHAAIGGSSCMENDMLTWRKIKFPATPRYGDVVVYPNTAGYQMDKSESEFHQIPLPPKIVVAAETKGFVWKIDK
ncbi:type III PLP-dependent enzyme domain-containing protein [Paraburkholderia strydomiana]|uniref:alanine racemase n=1 Tax=Paraburkholderia strydomiana TaxID=1245417 RepID=UPI0028577714|nr:alanine racemase [Paraburkholderia strydomiana]MDR7010041.1 diaminopimelate decarboxylase [Paraburkholderia strydomiana]